MLVVTFIFILRFGANENLTQNIKKAKEQAKTAMDSLPAKDLKPLADAWNLVLVNIENPIPDDFSVKLKKIPGGEVDERIAPFLLQMIEDAKTDGVDLEFCSGYRSVELQKKLYNENLNFYRSQGNDESTSKKLTEKYVQPPRHSEHHTGLAVDFLTEGYQSLDQDFSKTKAYQWLKKNAAKYGFIERYQKEKEELTKISWEPWHYRYVGAENADIMNSSNVCLEEYLNFS